MVYSTGSESHKNLKKEKDELTLKDKEWRDFSGRVFPEHKKNREDMKWSDTLRDLWGLGSWCSYLVRRMW